MRRILVYNSTCVRGTFGVEDGRLAQRPLRAQEALPEVSENLWRETEGVRTRENGRFRSTNPTYSQSNLRQIITKCVKIIGYDHHTIIARLNNFIE